MNIQPYRLPDQHWPPKLNLWWFHLAKPTRRKSLRQQKIERIDVEGLEHLEKALADGNGVLLAPNHSFHWDSYCLLEGADRLSKPFYFMSAWQVFAMSSWFQRLSMQKCGCFSVDREGVDMQAMKTAVDILQNRPHPLVIFPEGDVYHTNDRVTPFRDGAAAIALLAAKKSERPISVIPVAIKRWYVEDPHPSMLQTLQELEKRLYWRPRHGESILDRILHVANALLALKELERFRESSTGDLPARIQRLANAILESIESRYGLSGERVMIPERVKEVRRKIIAQQQEFTDKASGVDKATESMKKQWAADMDDMFLVTQLYSYPGDYLLENPSWERMAETLDKLEEDALGAVYPSVRGARVARVHFGEPIQLSPGKEKRMGTSELTDSMESRVQAMLDHMNLHHTPERHSPN